MLAIVLSSRNHGCWCHGGWPCNMVMKPQFDEFKTNNSQNQDLLMNVDVMQELLLAFFGI